MEVGDGVAVRGRNKIEAAVVTAGPPLTIRFGGHVEWGGPLAA